RGGKRLGTLDRHRASIESQGSLSCLGAQDFKPALLIDITLSDSDAVRKIGADVTCRRRDIVDRKYANAAALEFAGDLWRAYDDELRVAHRTFPARTRFKVHCLSILSHCLLGVPSSRHPKPLCQST